MLEAWTPSCGSSPKFRLIAWMLVLSAFLSTLSGCGTTYNLANSGGSPPKSVRGKRVEGVPQTAIYGGIRQDLYWLQTWNVGGGGYGAWVIIFELTACLALDTILLPVTIPKNAR